MKKYLCLLLTLILIFPLWGCQFEGNSMMEPAVFYYPWADLEAKMEQDPNCTAIGSETREASGHGGDLTYLLSLYLRGPLDPDLHAPFPTGCRLLDVTMNGDTLRVTLDAPFATLKNTELTLACACLAKTCFSLTDAAQVQIIAAGPDGSGSVDMTIGIDSVLLADDSFLSSQPATEESQ